MLSPMATKRVKSAEPRAANVGTATVKASSGTAAMRAKLLLRILVLLWLQLEPVTEVHADEVCVGLVRPVDVRARPVRAALLEVEDELGEVDGERSLVIADAEGCAFAVGVRQQRAHRLDRLRVLVVQHAEAHVPGRIDGVVRAEAVRVRVLPVLGAGDEDARGVAGDVELLEAAPRGVRDVELEVPVRNGRGGDAERDRKSTRLNSS